MKFGDENFGFLLTGAARLMRAEFIRTLQDSPLTLARARALVHLARNEGMRQVDLADLLEIQPMTLARLVDQLAAEGLVERRADPSDRRVHRLFLTPDAKPQLDIIQSVEASVRAKALAGASDTEREHTLCVLRRVCGNLAAR